MSILAEDFDEAKTAIINPEDMIRNKAAVSFPDIVISTFTEGIIDKLFEGKEREVITYIHAGRVPIYRLNYKGKDIAVFVSRVGSPASVAGAEQVIALGARKLIYFGSCGVLDNSIGPNEIVIPTHAIRDEGTSYHYLEQTADIALDVNNLGVLIKILDQLDIPYHKGKTWTIDALFRETEKKFKKRKEQGAIAVEMECSALTAVARFRGVSFIQFLYSADNLDADKWDPRTPEREAQKDKKDERYLKIALEYAVID
jgi:uridine phosphorylase